MFISMVLDSRKSSILNTLLSREGYVTGESLSTAAQAGVRTVRTDIRDLSHGLSLVGIPLRSMPGLGYRIDPEHRAAVRRWMEEDCEIHPASPAERRLYFIGTLLEGPLDLRALPPGFSQSPSTREKDLESSRKWFAKSALKIVRRGDVLVLEGEESAIRNAYQAYFMESAERTGRDIGSILKDSFHEYDAAVEALEKFLAASGLSLGDEAFERILILLLSCLRHPQRLRDSAPEEDDGGMVLRLERALSVLPGGRSRDLAREILNRYPEYFISDIPEEYRLKVEKALDRLRPQPPFVVDDVLRKGLERIYADDSGNPKGFLYPSVSLGELERRYPRAFRLALDFNALVDGDSPSGPNQPRLVRFGLCFAANYERHRLPKRRARIAVVCASGIGSAQLLSAKLEQFAERAEILGVFPRHSLPEAERLKPDIIVSTVPVDSGIPTFLIPDFFDDKRFEELASRLENIGDEASLLSEVLTEDLFLGEIAVDSAEKAIELMGKKLVEAGMTGVDFIERVKRRESICRTSIGNGLAIPHAMPEHGGKNAICSALLENPVRWGSDSVHTVFMLSLDGPEPVHRGLFREFNALLGDKETMRRFRREKNFGILRGFLNGSHHE